MAWLSLTKKSSWETLLNSEIVSEQILTIKRNNSNQLSEKVNRIDIISLSCHEQVCLELNLNLIELNLNCC